MSPSRVDAGVTRELEAAFAEGIEPVRRSWLYHVGLLLVTCVMVMLPVVYAAIVAAAGYGVYYHATHNYSLLSSIHNLRMSLLVYFGPLVVGGILVIFMAIPLIPRFGRRPKPLYVITKENEPLLYDLIMQICAAVNAPRPKEIHLLMEPQAYAAFRKGFLSFFGHDLVLAIGLPLLSSMTTRQLSGVIAHEMGHFSQGLGMRFSYLIDTINNWFARAIYGGSSLEDRLEDDASEAGGLIGLVLVVSHLFVRLTKGLLWLFMALGYLVSNFFSRQMEYDADLYEIQLAGSKDFETGMYVLTMLDIAWHKTCQMASRSIRMGVMADDMTALVKHQARLLAQNHKDDIINTTLDEDTHLFDTHPSMRDRIAVAKRRQSEGICHISSPPKALFADLKGLSRGLTREFYRRVVGEDASRCRLLGVDDYLDHYDKHSYELETPRSRMMP